MKCFNIKKYPILGTINSIDKLRSLPKHDLPILCKELRNYLLESVSTNSGHLASGLGVIELTVALHYVYNTPFDYLVWDIGHQAYVHKILTGRRDSIHTIRKKGGLHPFLCREESEYDVATAGHSSTSISIALGLAIACTKENHKKGRRRTVCVIGDGAMTAGMAFEAINHAGSIPSDLLIILNDNKMSISENVGALKNHLSSFYPSNSSEKNPENILNKNVTIFDLLNIKYLGPYDGHNLFQLIDVLQNARNLSGPHLLHVITKKGKGYSPAEKNPIKWHAVNKFDLNQSEEEKIVATTTKSQKIDYSKTFGIWLNEIAKHEKKLIAITPAMCEGSGMSSFSKQYLPQYVDVGIAEQHAIALASGFAIAKLRPVVAIYSTFLQRCYDQIIHDIALPKLPVLLAIDRAGIVGFDGQTHQGIFDISFLRCIPNLILMTPSDENELINMLHTGFHYKKGPIAVRYPRGSSNKVSELVTTSLSILPIGKSITRRLGKNIAILNFGHLFYEAQIVADNLNATLVDMRFIKPLDEQQILKIANNYEVLITLEEATIFGGAGSAVNEFLIKKKSGFSSILNIGLPDEFIPHGSQEEIRKCYGLDSIGIQKTIINWLVKINKDFLLN
ncbi:MAG: 1-deoxy-D-xylulose-5-phosphate synthase [Candidatus Dasytiphilus stammeri]